MISINPILAAAAADIVVGMLWYSDYGFGPMYRKLSGHKLDMRKDLYVRIALQVVGSIMIATAFYIAILTFQKSQAMYSQEALTRLYSWFFMPSVDHAECMSSLKIAGFIWLGFFVPTKLSCLAWSPVMVWQKFAIKACGKLAQFLAMAAVLSYLG